MTYASAERRHEPPVNYEIEQALLGAILTNNHAYEQVADFLRPEHFADATHARVYAACASLIDGGQHASAITLKNMFEQEAELEDVGGWQYLRELQINFVSIIGARDYAEQLVDLWRRRRLLQLGENAVHWACEDWDVTADQVADRMEQGLSEIAYGEQEGRGLVSLGEATAEAMARLQAAWQSDGEIVGLPTGFRDLDALTGGLEAPDVIVLAGRPSMGKTTVALQAAYRMASAGAPVGVFSMEMGEIQLTQRLIAERAGVPLRRLQSGRVGIDERMRAEEEAAKLKDLPLMIDGTARLTVAQIAARARRMKRKRGLDAIMVDHLRYIAPVDRRQPRYQTMGENMRLLKGLGKSLEVPVVVLCQLNRQTVQRDDRRPRLEDLRDSGEIEEDADDVWFLHREGYYLEREEPRKGVGENEERYAGKLADWNEAMNRERHLCEVIVAKQRNGPIDTVKLYFDARLMRVDDLHSQGEIAL